MGAVTPGETLGTLYNIRVGTNKTKQQQCIRDLFYKFPRGDPVLVAWTRLSPAIPLDWFFPLPYECAPRERLYENPPETHCLCAGAPAPPGGLLKISARGL